MEKLYQSRDAGKISIVKFTADWCPNCVFVESTSLYTEKVIDTVKKGDIHIYIADITRKNHEAEALLEKLGSHSIPFLAIFPPHSDFNRPICLRDIYSEGDVLNAIEEARKAIPEVNIDSIRFE
jgi:thiol:disulfide interchange protein